MATWQDDCTTGLHDTWGSRATLDTHVGPFTRNRHRGVTHDSETTAGIQRRNRRQPRSDHGCARLASRGYRRRCSRWRGGGWRGGRHGRGPGRNVGGRGSRRGSRRSCGQGRRGNDRPDSRRCVLEGELPGPSLRCRQHLRRVRTRVPLRCFLVHEVSRQRVRRCGERSGPRLGSSQGQVQPRVGPREARRQGFVAARQRRGRACRSRGFRPRTASNALSSPATGARRDSVGRFFQSG